MPRHKKCKNCKSPFQREEHKINNYNIIINRCKCDWELIDVMDSTGTSLKTTLDKKVIQKMLKSGASNIKL